MFEAGAVMRYLAADKKRAAGVNRWVLPKRIGTVTLVHDVADKEIIAAIAFVRQWLNSQA
jgi:3-dehydroquinate synthetase